MPQPSDPTPSAWPRGSGSSPAGRSGSGVQSRDFAARLLGCRGVPLDSAPRPARRPVPPETRWQTGRRPPRTPASQSGAGRVGEHRALAAAVLRLREGRCRWGSSRRRRPRARNTTPPARPACSRWARRAGIPPRCSAATARACAPSPGGGGRRRGRPRSRSSGGRRHGKARQRVGLQESCLSRIFRRFRTAGALAPSYQLRFASVTRADIMSQPTISHATSLV